MTIHELIFEQTDFQISNKRFRNEMNMYKNNDSSIVKFYGIFKQHWLYIQNSIIKQRKAVSWSSLETQVRVVRKNFNRCRIPCRKIICQIWSKIL